MNIDLYTDRAKQAIQSAQSLALARRHQQLAPDSANRVGEIIGSDRPERHQPERTAVGSNPPATLGQGNQPDGFPCLVDHHPTTEAVSQHVRPA